MRPGDKGVAFATTRPAEYEQPAFPQEKWGEVQQAHAKKIRDRTAQQQKSRCGEDSFAVLALGDNAVGKTTLIMTWCGGTVPTFTPDGIDNQDKHVMVDEWPTRLKLDDFFGDRSAIGRDTYPNYDCFLLCFSVASRASFESIKWRWHHEVQLLCPTAPCVLVGCKRDLRQAEPPPQAGAVVSADEARQLCRELCVAGYVECSALTDVGTAALDEVFLTAARAARARYESRRTKNRKRCVVM